MRIILFILTFVIFSCNKHSQKENLNKIAEEYVRLALDIGRYDADFVDAYYGPDSLKPAGLKLTVFPKYEFLRLVNNLQNRLKEFKPEDKNDSLAARAEWMSSQLIACGRRIRIFSGDRHSFDEESKDLFGVVAPIHPESYYRDLLKSLEEVLPGNGNLATRFQELANRFIIPRDKLDTVFKTAIAESRQRTIAHYKLPASESCTLEFVTGKSWSGYNWYQGNYKSLIQINTDLDIFIERAIDVSSHESYPGHHVYNMLLEKNLYRDKGWIEMCVYPLFSPQSLIAEGSANYGIDVAFPGNQHMDFARNVLLPLAGLDTTGISLYFKALSLKAELNFARNEAGRGLLSNTMTESQAVDWLMKYCLYNRETALKSVSFIRKYGSYVINYNYGRELVKHYIESGSGTDSTQSMQWKLFGELLSNPVTPRQLLEK